MTSPEQSRARETPRAAALALAAVGLACASATSPTEDAATGRPPTTPAASAPAAGDPQATPPPTDPAPSAETATRVLVDFREHTVDELAAAYRTVLATETPERYEERGEVDGKPYVYTKERYPKLGLTLHFDGARLSNVEYAPSGG